MKQSKYYIGIDIAKDTFTVAIFTSPDAPYTIKEDLANTLDGFEELIKWLTEQKIQAQDSLICMEATGVYNEAICYYLYSKGYNISVEDPSKIARASGKANKNDKQDSKKIAEYAYRHYDKLKPWIPRKEILEHIQVLLTTREQLVKQKVANMNLLKALKIKHLKTPLATETLEKIIRDLKQDIETLEKHIKDLIDKDTTIKESVALLDTIPGVGWLLGANLAVLSNGFTIPLDYRKSASLIGVVPYEHISGKSVRKKSKSKGFGPHRLRKLLKLASKSVKTHVKEFKEYFHRKLKLGKPKKLILNNIANKLLKIICAVLNSKKPYIKDFVSVNPSLLKNSQKVIKKTTKKS